MTDVTHILKDLNERQREAVVAPPGPLLITAGAGSGKTAVLVRRIAWLIEATGVSRHRIMAVTFTNKAAREMRSRVERLLGDQSAPSKIGTFHGLSNIFLRVHHQEAGLHRDFTIMDADDQKSFINRLVRDHQLPIGDFPVRGIQYYMNKCKEQQIRAANAIPMNNREAFYAEVYRLYEHECNLRGLVDFAELLLRTLEVMQRNEIVRDENQERFQHVLVDEFQDTNALQLEWLKMFFAKYQNVTAVGDEDQSIYGWRGALAENMLEFENQFSNAKLIRLEQNYRSTQPILNAANAVISNNQHRYKKKLWTEQKGGRLIRLFSGEDFEAEAEFIADTVEKFESSKLSYSDFAVLYRTNAQSRVFEVEFSSRGIPFRLYGGVRFYSRLEIKHVLAYLRLLVDPHNNDAFERIVNNPPRGIGDGTMRKVVEVARNKGISNWDATLEFISDTSSQSRMVGPLRRFIQMMDGLRNECQGISLYEIIDRTIKDTQIREYYQVRNIDIDQARVENLDEMLNAGANFIRNKDIDDNENAIVPFLDEVTLDAGDTHDANPDAVQLMTLHIAKGLEFPVVFLTGLDEYLLPHANALYNRSEYLSSEPDALEEERRLCYVGMTRAQQQLYLTRANRRLLHGQWQTYKPSRFVREIPTDCVEFVKHSKIESVTTPAHQDELSDLLGKEVQHVKFGNGIVLNAEEDGEYWLVKVKFHTKGEKLLIWDQANLEVLEN